jgi:hypothetical protein
MIITIPVSCQIVAQLMLNMGPIYLCESRQVLTVEVIEQIERSIRAEYEFIMEFSV